MILKMQKDPLWTSEEIASYCKGTIHHAFEASGVSIDSRKINEGDLFIALEGPHFNGHQFVADALDRGAAGAIVSHVPKGVPDDAPLILVEDTMTALNDLGKGGRARAKTAKVVGVTGSVGKTGTKEMLFHVLNHAAPSFATEGNLNNHWGLPLSLARMPEETAYGIFEMGMNHAGEIAPLSRLCEPDLSIITWIAPAHIENFDSIEGIARAKSEIFEGMKASGIAVLPRDNDHFSILLAEARTKGLTTILTFGKHEDSDARLLTLKETEDGTIIQADILGEKISFTMPLVGAHHAMNAMAVLLAAKKMGVSLAHACETLARIKPIKGRGNRIDIPLGDGKVPLTLIDESYNASPEAMKAAFHVLGMMKPKNGGRKVAVLGDMLELGSHSPALHAGLAPFISDEGIDLVLCCGPMMAHMAKNLPQGKVLHKADSQALADAIPSLLQPGDVVMVKGSLGSKMVRVVDAVKAMASKKEAING